MPDLPTEPVKSLQHFKGIDFPGDIRFSQILVTGPPGAGKTTMIERLGGWSEEGYLDLAQRHWWRSETLAVRPREIHLGIPFVGLENAVSVFDAQFLDRDPLPAIDFDRIRLPPRKRVFFSVDWYHRYVFDFVLPPPELLFERRAARARHRTHPVDELLSLEICAAQHQVFRRVAEYLHQVGFTVYIRDALGSPPLRFVDPPSFLTMRSQRPITFRRLVARPKALVAALGLGAGHNLRLSQPYSLGDTKVRLPLDGVPIEITLGLSEKKLHLYPETRLNEKGKAIRHGSNFIIVDPLARPGEIGGFLRLTPKNWLSLGSGNALQQALFEYPATVDEAHLVIIHGRDALVLRNLSAAGTVIAPALRKAGEVPENKLRRLREIFGGPIELLPADQALTLIEEVNRLLQQETYRPRDDRGMPGGLLMLPLKLTPILVADLHAQIDNLLTVLSHNAFLDALEAGTAALVILGDAPHSEVDGQLRKMESSMLLMDLIFKLKLRFPEQVFYVRGNHDSFSEDVAKDGIPQGLLWAKELGEQRGSVYLKAMGEFYRLLPYIVASPEFVACHAAAPTTKVSKEMLVNIHRHPSLILEVLNNRLRRPEQPLGYSRRDVKRLRRSLELEKHTPFIVGHSPLDREQTLWLNVDGITNHHVLFSANPEEVGVFTRVDGMMIPLVYPVDALTPIINRLEAEPG